MASKKSRLVTEDLVNEIAMCCRCNKWKSFSEFTRIDRGPNRRKTQSSCKECQSLWMRNKISKDRESGRLEDALLGQKKCNVCGITKPLSEMRKYRGDFYRSKYMPMCIDCGNAKQRDRYRRKNSSRRAMNFAYTKTPSGRASVMHRTTKARSKHVGIQYSLTKDWFLERLNAGKCEVTGLEFSMTPGSKTRNLMSPSVDRINPFLGYTPENCQLVILSYNLAKCDGDPVHVLNMSRAIAAKWQHECAVLDSCECSLDYD